LFPKAPNFFLAAEKRADLKIFLDAGNSNFFLSLFSNLFVQKPIQLAISNWRKACVYARRTYSIRKMYSTSKNIQIISFPYMADLVSNLQDMYCKEINKKSQLMSQKNLKIEKT